MARINLDVPFSQKDEAKSLGARWDPALKVWYAPDGINSLPLSQWIPKTEKALPKNRPEFSVRSPYYYVVQSISNCWKCNLLTRVFSFMLPEEHEQFVPAEDELEDDDCKKIVGWYCHGYRGTISDVSSLSPLVSKKINRFTDNFKHSYSRTAGYRYMMNHCEHCGAKLGDFYMHCQPGKAFFPTSPEEANRMILTKINEQFEANCGVGFSTLDFMECMQIQEEQ